MVDTLKRHGRQGHFTFIQSRDQPVSPTLTPEDLVVFYVLDREA
jgi:hypothetical protein